MAKSTLMIGSSLEKFLTKTFEQSLEMNKLSESEMLSKAVSSHLQ